MELIENLLQLLTTFLGALLSGIAWQKAADRRIFAALLLRLLCLGVALLDTVPAAVPHHAAGLLCVGVWLGRQRDFLRILQVTLTDSGECGFRCRKAWLAPLVGVPLLGFYCTYGDILSNLIWCSLMIWLSFCAVRGLFYANTLTGKARNRRYFHIGMLCYVGSEYLLWTVGCFWSAASFASPAFWCDLLLTFALLGLLPAVRKAVEL